MTEKGSILCTGGKSRLLATLFDVKHPATRAGHVSGSRDASSFQRDDLALKFKDGREFPQQCYVKRWSSLLESGVYLHIFKSYVSWCGWFVRNSRPLNRFTMQCLYQH